MTDGPDDVIKVLAVDDVEQNLVALEALLARPGLELLKATTGNDALEILLREDVALALLDVRMPDMDGFALAELIRGRRRTESIPIIFLTAGARDPNRTFRGYETGAVDFLHKPIDARMLRSKVEVFVQLHAQKRQLAQQLAELREALRLNERFAAVLGHDLRNPLSAIVTNAELLQRASDAPLVQTAAERIRNSTARMARMIDQLLDFARIRSGRLELDPRPGDLRETALAICDELEPPHEERRTIRVEASGDTRAVFDADRMSQVLSNLLGNALRHGEQDAPVLVTIDGAHAEHVVVGVANRGTIPPEIMPRLFEPFRSGGEASPSRGLGLGLHIVEQFVGAHGGKVSVRSTEVDGTVFELVLPRAGAGATGGSGNNRPPR